jgi:hypothetical protein
MKTYGISYRMTKYLDERPGAHGRTGAHGRNGTKRLLRKAICQLRQKGIPL